jgi:hypothetical protein
MTTMPDDTRYDRRLRAVRRAIADPGALLPREVTRPGQEIGAIESMPNWQARAVMAVIGPWLKDEDPDA